MKAIELTCKGIKCDAPLCDFNDPNAALDEKWIGTPCPKCGANLLTPEDWALLKMLITVTDWANEVVGPVPDDSKFERLRVHMDGSGIPSKVSQEQEAGK